MDPTDRILIIDDDRELGSMLAEFLGGEGWSIELAHDGRAGLEAALSMEPAAVVLDVMLPGMSGFDILRSLRQRSAVPVIMLTARGEETDRIVGLELGADDYLPKPFNPRELAARLRAILRRRPGPAEEPTAEFNGLKFDRAARRVSLDGAPLQLTGAEYAILEQLAESAGTVVSKDQLCQEALGRELLPYDRSIDTHISRLRGKLGNLPDGEPRIQSVRGRGYVLVSGV
ncbi:response regulator transcription factor [Wenzhouxiangella marina]|uniref:Two component transcriptional regulator, winged helix family n=1 Tax=Wenzhouxiangella marina TaxID=1579979 RepID=A0A0K0XSF5_9GAMM|nr:response regulator transcription factor [Wenzhouxiangella marina]AKS40590.1 Two component transcriptional regulator, winged helix family [Wenzhouxiangella marina]MBB6088358.1 two-component system response regulator CpxR [Wenzhouxiangella marina]